MSGAFPISTAKFGTFGIAISTDKHSIAPQSLH